MKSDQESRSASRTRRSALQAAEQIPPLPDNVVRVLALLNDRQAEPEDLVRLLEQDPVLVGRMLSMANSPFYGLSHDITSTKQAVMVLGFRGVRSLVLATSTSRFMRQDFACYGHDRDGLWKHAVLVSALGRAIATETACSVDQREEVFIGGLMHDIGKMVLASRLLEAGFDPAERAITPAIERDLVGLDHCEASSLVLSKWNLAQSVQELAERHEPEEPLSSADPLPLRVLCIANDIAHGLGIGYLPGAAPARQIPDPAGLLDLTPDAWHKIEESASTAAQRALEQFV